MLRKTGILVTIISLLVGGVIVSYYFINMMQHARVDSEGGTFVYGMGMLFSLTATMLGVLFGTVLWGIGIRIVRESVAISLSEEVFQRILIVLSALWAGLVIYKIVANHV